MHYHSGVAAQMFRAMAESNVNIEMITTSDIKISTLVQRADAEAALKAVHRVFALESETGAPPKVGWAQPAPSVKTSAGSDEILKQVVGGLASMEDIVVSDVQLDETQSLISVNRLPDVPGVCAELFAAVAEGDIMVDTIVQNVSRQGHTVISFTVPRRDHDQCLLLVHEVLSQWEGAACYSEREIDQLSVIGVGLRSHTGVGERMFRALAESEINVKMINTSEIRMSAVVAAEQGQTAHKALLKAFRLG
jgi:aspartate kinase